MRVFRPPIQFSHLLFRERPLFWNQAFKLVFVSKIFYTIIINYYYYHHYLLTYKSC